MKLVLKEKAAMPLGSEVVYYLRFAIIGGTSGSGPPPGTLEVYVTAAEFDSWVVGEERELLGSKLN